MSKIVWLLNKTDGYDSDWTVAAYLTEAAANKAKERRTNKIITFINTSRTLWEERLLPDYLEPDYGYYYYVSKCEAKW